MPQSALRLDIQGLRAVAVALIIVFHLTPKTIPGGYIGVDVFFVLSGYLITAHLLREALSTGSIRLLEFWARRVRRLLPAAILVLTVSALAVIFLLPQTLQEQNLIEIAFASFYALNWRLASDSVDYLATDNVPSIAQHYWSLSVEEQFYIVWPIIILFALWATARSSRIGQRWGIGAALVVVFATSLAFSVIETARSQPSAYFVTTTRAWEFAAGGLIALLPMVRLPRLVHTVVGWIALLLGVIAPAFLFHASTPFPGWVALVPVLGIAVLIWIGDSDDAWSPQYLLKHGPIQLLGDVSYSAYLWHWPIIIVITSLLGRSPGWIWGSAIFATTVVLAIATKSLVEDPVRRAPGFLRLRVPTFGLMVAGIATILTITLPQVASLRGQAQDYVDIVAEQSADTTGCFGAYAILNSCPDPYAMTLTVNPAASKSDGPWAFIESYEGCTTSDEIAGSFEYDCDTGREDAELSVMLVGDSQAYSAFPAFGTAADAQGWDLHMLSRASCPGFGPTVDTAIPEEEDRCAEWSIEVQQRLLDHDRIDVVVFLFRESVYPDMTSEMTQLVTSLEDAGKRVIFMRQAPEAGPGVNAPDCIEVSTETDSPCAWEAAQADNWVSAAIAATGAGEANPWDVLCHDGLCESVIGGTLVYRDSNHYTATFGRTLAPDFGQVWWA